MVFAVGSAHGFEPLRAWFAAIYEVLLGAEQGPRFGGFIALYGVRGDRGADRRGAGGAARRPRAGAGLKGDSAPRSLSARPHLLDAFGRQRRLRRQRRPDRVALQLERALDAGGEVVRREGLVDPPEPALQRPSPPPSRRGGRAS